ncbi:MAG TPA: immunoglobulin domain-containing protein [Candidatus Paceibacterota bacterium]|nr:immunoglobulin domain-containing protein [Verrucomicrobiota bacterium]HSA11093.1 immunoglobulin domain-containing protein [Candidatus Paceibacterota bacterium]
MLNYFASAIGLLLLLSAVQRPLVAAPVSAQTSAPLASQLAPDGTLDLTRGFSGTLDARGWTMVAAPGSGPRFVRSTTASPASASGAFAGGPRESAVEGDNNWDGRFVAPPGVDGVIHALAVSGTSLFVGGDFSSVGGISASNVARWNGTAWEALGDGVGGLVLALAVSGTNVYVGGVFTGAGGISATNIACWNGADWSALGSGVDNDDGSGAVAALAVRGTSLYAGGSFTHADGVSAANIAVWNGSTWSALGDGLSDANPDNSAGVAALVVSGTDLIAGGSFTTAGGIAATNIARWDGSAWSALGDGTDGTVLALGASGPNVYAGGGFTTAGGVAAANIAVWNGSTWSALGNGVDELVFAIAVSGNNVYVGGAFTAAGNYPAGNIARWNGSAWTPLSSGVGGSVYALATNSTTLYVGGDFDTAGGLSANNLAQWNGFTWSALGAGSGNVPFGTVLKVAVSGVDVYVGGFFTVAGEYPANNIAHWNGSFWSALDAGVDGPVSALCISGTDLYVGGSFGTAGGVSAANIAKWDGGSWSALGGGMDDAVTAIAVVDADVYAGGSFTMAGGVPVHYIARWDGAAWNALGEGLDGPVFALAGSSPDLFVGGSFSTADGTITVNNIARWNGANWSELGLGMDDAVHALAVAGNGLYAGGDFTEAGGESATGVARWDGMAWSALGGGVNNAETNASVAALDVQGQVLFVGGSFTLAGTTEAANVARWDGANWTALGSGINQPVATLAVGGTDVYFGGNFTRAGDLPSYHFAQWHDAPAPPNDDFEKRILVSGALVVTNGDNTGGGRQMDEPYHAGIYGGRSIWWSWTAPTTDTVTISTAGTVFDTVLAVYAGAELSALAEVASNDDDPNGGVTSLVTFAATSGATYQIAVDGYNGNYGSVALRIVAGVPPIITAQPQGQTVMAGANVAFAVTATGTAPLSYQWRLAGTNLPGATASSLNLTDVQLADAGDYSVVVANDAGSVVSSDATLVVNAPPVIIAHPQGQTVSQGDDVTFTVIATGSPVLTYQWRFAGADLPAATGSSFTRANVQPADAGNYSVVVSNSFGGAPSSNATLVVLVPPAILTHPVSLTIPRGSNATFTVTAAGTEPLSYQWRFEGDDLPGATASSFTRTNSQPADAGNYSVMVTNLAGSVFSSNASLALSLPQALALSSPLRLENGQFQFTVTGAHDQIFSILASTDLSGWIPLSTNTLTNGLQVYTDSEATNFPRRFYRAQSAP